MNDHIITSDQIPDDPLKMPPPYWRSPGAIIHILDSLRDLPELLSNLLIVHESTEIQLNGYYERHPNEPSNDDELEEFGEICDDLWELEEKVKTKAELAIFMSAIQAEDFINRFCVFNIHKDIAESIESLSPAEKLLVASAAVGDKSAIGTVAYEAIKKLSAWRNAF